MSVIIFILLFILIPAMFKKDYILYSFAFFYPILPEYFAIDLGSKFPLLTASRLLIIIITVYAIYKKGINLMIIYTKDNKLIIYVITFVLLTFLSNAAYLSDGGFKYMLLTFLEKLLLALVLSAIVDSKEKLYGCINCLVMASVILCVFGIVEAVTSNNVFYYLETTTRQLTMTSYQRLNITRAEATFGHPICFSVYLLLIIPFIMHYCDITKKNLYRIMFGLAICALISTVSRASIAIFVCSFFVMLFLKNKKERKIYFNMIGIAIIIILLSLIFVPSLSKFANQVFASILNVLGFDFELTDFGRNESGILSRLFQFSMIEHVFEKNKFLFGCGIDYIYKNDVFLRSASGYVKMTSIDNEYLLVFIENGIIGLFAKIFLYFNIWKASFKRRHNDYLGQAFFFAFTMFFVTMFTVCELTTSKILWVVIGLFMSYVKYNNNSSLSQDIDSTDNQIIKGISNGNKS